MSVKHCWQETTTESSTVDAVGNIISVTNGAGEATTYDALNRITEIHRPNGISTYNTYNARNQITELVNTCDDCGWMVSSYAYTYDDKHDGKHEDGKHDDLYPHGTAHSGKHDKDATFAYQIVQTDRTFTYDDAGKLLSATENEYTYNGESYNPNIESQYLRARYYNVTTTAFITEDSYLGDITEPLTLNRYNYCVSSPLNYVDPSGFYVEDDITQTIRSNTMLSSKAQSEAIRERIEFYQALRTLGSANATYDYVMDYDYSERDNLQNYSGGANFLYNFNEIDAIKAAAEQAKKMNEENSDYVDGGDIEATGPMTYVSADYINWLMIAEGTVLYPYLCDEDNAKAKQAKNVTIGIGFTFDTNEGEHWEILSKVTGWDYEQIREIVDGMYSGKEEEIQKKYILTIDQANQLFAESEQRYVDDVNHAIRVFSEENPEFDATYTQCQMEAMFDYAYTPGMNGTDEVVRNIVNNPDRIIYYYLRHDYEGAIEAVKEHGSYDRRRVNQMNLFFNNSYEFFDGKDRQNILRKQFGLPLE